MGIKEPAAHFDGAEPAPAVGVLLQKGVRFAMDPKCL